LKVELIAHTQLSEKFKKKIEESIQDYQTTDGQIIALTAIRNCYSATPPTHIVDDEAKRYFGKTAKDGGEGTDADRLIRQIIHSGHKSTIEHLSFTFAIEGVSRTLLAQLTRHRVGFSFSVESQRYCRLGSNDKSGGAEFYIPEIVKNNSEALEVYKNALKQSQTNYDKLRELGISPEESRELFPNATLTDIVMTVNLRSLLDFYSKRQHGKGAQEEICNLADELRKSVIEVEPWTDQFFEETTK
jgi:thymidylate synthase (FAD)